MKPKRKPRPITVPTLVAMYTAPEVEIGERMALMALRGEWATFEHYNILADVRDLLTLAAADRNDTEVLRLCQCGFDALHSIAERYRTTHCIRASLAELADLAAMVEVSNDWWKRQSGTLYRDANRALDKARQSLRTAPASTHTHPDGGQHAAAA